MELSFVLVQQIILFFLLLTRITGVIMSAPIFGSNYLPSQIKVAFSIVITLVFVPLFGSETVPQLDLMNIVLAIFMELMVGIGIGLIANIFFSAVHIAGQIIDMQMGFAMANVMDPQYETQVPLTGHFKYILAILIFLSINGHHLLIRTIYQSYEFFPMGEIAQLDSGALVMNELISTVFVLAVQVSAPALGTLFLTNIALGVLARTVPQMNVFIIGFPVKIFIGILAMMLMLPFYNMILETIFEHIWDGIYNFLDSL
ncbi:flagellar biosynthetic protein FliR [Natranaerobius trueperi]|uniref:flagellar biosynthetic protein FliR n=1 Tax=Natranaerobius trueperi TaxID=759412 RepID=UPI001302F444|nr:flagellar biosynthetic protein FliR [Natranaerobius trueperi]